MDVERWPDRPGWRPVRRIARTAVRRVARTAVRRVARTAVRQVARAAVRPVRRTVALVARRVVGVAALAVLPGLLVGSEMARAHVDYVVDDDGSPEAAMEFLAQVLSRPANAALVAVVGLAVLAGVVGYRRYRPASRDVAALRDALAEYEPYLPWMLRLSVGLPLVGAGFAGYLFSPAVEVSARLLQVSLGFLLLFGLASRAVAVVGLSTYLLALVAYPDLLLAAEYVGGFLGIVLLGSGRPSADHLLQRVAAAEGTLYGRIDPVHRLAGRFDRAVAPYERFAPTVVRVATGATFAYLGLNEKLVQPNRALRVVERYDLTAVVPVDPGMWVLGAGLTELAVGLALLLGLYTRATAALAFLVLTLTLFGLPDDPVLAHVTLFGFASMLFVTGGGPLSLDRRLAGAVSRVDSVAAGA